MKKIALALLLPLGLVVASAGVARAQAADEVIDKHIAAIGGRDALGKLTSRKSTGTVTLTTPAGDLSGPYESYAKGPNKARIYMRIDLTAVGGPGEMVIEQRFDGTNGIMMNSMQGETNISGDQLATMRNGAFPSALLTYKQTGMKLELQPKEKVGAKDAIVLLVTPKTGPSSRVYFDPDTYLVMRTVTKLSSPEMGELVQTSELSDYRTVDGVKVAFQIVNTNAVQSVTVKIAKIEHNVAIDDAMFGKK